MKKLEQTEGIRTQLAFEMFYGAKPSLKATTITGTLVLVGYGHDNVDKGCDYINLSNLSKEKNNLTEDTINYLEKLGQQGLYIKIDEDKNDIALPVGAMVFVKNGFDYLANSSWSSLNKINLIMNQYGKKTFKWYGQVSHKEKTILPYMVISVEHDIKNKEFFLCEPVEFLIEKYMGKKK